MNCFQAGNALLVSICLSVYHSLYEQNVTSSDLDVIVKLCTHSKYKKLYILNQFLKRLLYTLHSHDCEFTNQSTGNIWVQNSYLWFLSRFLPISLC